MNHLEKFDPKNFIAEIGVNHENSMETAARMIEECARNKVGVIKFQSYVASKLAAQNSPSYWDTTHESTTSQIELFSRYDKFGIDEYRELAALCKQHDVEFLTTPFDVDYVHAVADLVQRYKIASVDLTNHFLLDAIAETGKPVIMSTGASVEDEIHTSVDRLRRNGNEDITLLHCVTRYPTPVDEAGLNGISLLTQDFPELAIGYSDHTMPHVSHLILFVAMSLGATVIEKHYTHDKTLPGNDHYHAFDKADLEIFMKNVADVQSSLAFKGTGSQQDALRYARRGIYASTDIKAGEILTLANVVPLRPKMDFLGADELDFFVGKATKCDIKSGAGISREDLRS